MAPTPVIPRDLPMRRMFGLDDADDRASSISGDFEDLRIDSNPFSAPPPPGPLNDLGGKRGPLKEEEVKDVMYTVQYWDYRGILRDKIASDTAIDVSQVSRGGLSTKTKEPVIEIVTSIHETRARSHRRGRSPPRLQPYHYEGEEMEYTMEDMPEERDRPLQTKMLVHSPHLCAALSAVIGYYPDFEKRTEVPYTIPAPYQPLVHYWRELENYKTNQPPSHDAEYAAATARDIDVLLSFLEKTYGDRLEAERARWNNPEGSNATFEFFWALLKPGDIVYKNKQGSFTPAVVSSVSLIHNEDGVQTGYLVIMWDIVFQQTVMRRRMSKVVVHLWRDEKAVESLPVVPARFVPGGEKKVAEEEIRLGKMYWELAKQPAFREYDGPVSYAVGTSSVQMTGRVVVDCEGYDLYSFSGPRRRGDNMRRPRRIPATIEDDQLPQMQQRCTCKACGAINPGRLQPSIFAGFDNLNPKKDSLPENQDFYFHVIGRTIPAFLLGERRWGTVRVDKLSDVRVDQDAFKYLVLDSEVKATVKAMMGKFASQDGKLEPWPADFVKNKGEGRIFLLHGSPGVGKTCTAECAAELARRPLLALTSGDIGSSMTAASVEAQLSYYLSLGERFGALVLIDEADVYLERRHVRDLSRNGLVSVFLRALEYYKGVLFLTTNRVETFDDAFTSRIHIALHYRQLKNVDRMRIWMHNFERLERDSNGKCHVTQSTREYAYESPDLRRLRWNGREIRNALQTAVALAETEATESGLERITVADHHLRAVVKMSSGFKAFLRARNKRNDKKAAATGDEDDDEADQEAVPESDASSEEDYYDSQED